MIKSDITPFKIYENLYFVGSSRVSVHIIKTKVGLVMIDTGYPDMYEQILDSMCQLGLQAKDICAIFHSHGHIDHFGCTLKFKKLSGAKTYVSQEDNDIINGKYNLSWADELGYVVPQAFDCDVLVGDGECFTFGDTVIRCCLTPGHTDGVLSFFINLDGNKEGVIAAMHGGVGMNSMTASFLDKYGLSFDCRDKFKEGLKKLATEKVDIVLGNHPEQNQTNRKLKKVLAGESIIDSDEWKRFLTSVESNLDSMINKEKLKK